MFTFVAGLAISVAIWVALDAWTDVNPWFAAIVAVVGTVKAILDNPWSGRRKK